MKPVDRVTKAFRDDYRSRRIELAEFDALMDKYEIGEPARTALHAWAEERLVAPTLELAEAKIRGAQHRN